MKQGFVRPDRGGAPRLSSPTADHSFLFSWHGFLHLAFGTHAIVFVRVHWRVRVTPRTAGPCTSPRPSLLTAKAVNAAGDCVQAQPAAH